MDTGLVALVVLATFATVHERVIELIRRVFRGPPEYTDDKALADGFGHGPFRGRPKHAGKDELAVDVAPPSPGLIRRLVRRGRWNYWRKVLDGMTIGPWSVMLAVILAVVTRANVLSLFVRAHVAPTTAGAPGASPMTNAVLVQPGETLLFFTEYLRITDDGGSFWLWSAQRRWQALLGCILMGLSTSLGSKFWHDLSSGLVDLREKAKEAPKKARTVLTPPAEPPGSTVVTLGAGEK